ncbi:MAG: porin family protein [Bacteroidota bacterium]
MKKLIQNVYVIGLVSMAVHNQAAAQEKQLLVGARFGVGESKINFEGLSGEKSKIAFTGGVSTTYHFNRFFGVGADFMAAAKGGRYRGYTERQDVLGNTIRYNYRDQYDIYTFEIPLTAKLRIPLNETFALKAFAGPNFQFSLYGTESRQYDDANYNEDYGYSRRKLNDLNTLELGVQYGAGLEVKSINQQALFIDFRMNESLSDLGTIQDRKVISNNYLISIGYLF